MRMKINMKQEEKTKGTGQRQRHKDKYKRQTHSQSFVGPRSAAASGQSTGESSNNQTGLNARCTMHTWALGCH